MMRPSSNSPKKAKTVIRFVPGDDGKSVHVDLGHERLHEVLQLDRNPYAFDAQGEVEEDRPTR
jgi:hypothetical protein